MKHRLLIALLCATLTSAPQLLSVAHAQEGATDHYKKAWKGVATLQTQKLNQKTRTLTAVYPVLASPRPVAKATNAGLKKQVLDQYNAFEQESRGSASHLGLMGNIKYEFQVVPTLELNHPRLISTTLLTYNYEGGAHGIDYTTGYVFGYPAGSTTPRRLHLADFFTTDLPTTRKRLNALMMAKLRASKNTDHEAMWVADGTVKSVTNKQMENFIVEKDGLRWFFAPYEMGPFANGEYELKFTSRELGPTFRSALLR